MNRRRTCALAFAVSLATFGMVVPAAGQVDLITIGGQPAKLIQVIDIPLVIEGSLRVDFRAGADTGCAAPCDVAGTVTWTPSTGGRLFAIDQRVGGRRELSAFVLLAPPAARPTVTSTRVTRARPGGGHGACMDSRSNDFGVMDFSGGARETIVARLLGRAAMSGGRGSDLLGSRCLGPADADLAPLLPTVLVDRGSLRRGGRALDFSATRAFASNGLAGTIRSSVKMHLGRAQISLDPEALLDAPMGEFRQRRLRELTATYSIERMTGSVETRFNGFLAAGLCAGLDSCGSTGSTRITPGPVAGEAEFTASGPRRLTRRQLSAALGLSRGPVPRGVDVYAFAYWEEDAGNVVTSTRDGDGHTCTERGTLEGGSIQFGFGPKRVSAAYADSGSFYLDPFSSRCPGPEIVDVAGAGPLARGSVPIGELRRRHVTFSLQRGVAFESDGYVGDSRSSLSFVLRRTRVETGLAVDFASRP